MKGVVHPRLEAQQDLVDIYQHIARKSGLRRAQGFLTSAEATFQRLASLPNIGARFEPDDPQSNGLRYLPVSRYRNFVVFYRPTAGGIEIIRVLHGARNLGDIFGAEPDEEEIPGDG